MLIPLSYFVDFWQSLTVLVIGDVMLDCYLYGTSDRLCQEAPVPVVAIAEQQDFPGGAANVAANASRLGANVILVSVTGNDEIGDRLCTALQSQNVSTDYLIKTAQRSTLAKQRIVANSHLVARFDQGSADVISNDLEHEVIKCISDLFWSCDVIIFSDYSYGLITAQFIQLVKRLQTVQQKTLAIDSKRLKFYQPLRASVVKPNYQQAIELLGLSKSSGNRVEQLVSYGSDLLALTGAERVIVTLDRDGALIFDQHQSGVYCPTLPAPTHHTSGAGDTFISTIALALAAHAPTEIAVNLAMAAAAIVVTQPGTTVCTADALHQAISEDSIERYAEEVNETYN